MHKEKDDARKVSGGDTKEQSKTSIHRDMLAESTHKYEQQNKASINCERRSIHPNGLSTKPEAGRSCKEGWMDEHGPQEGSFPTVHRQMRKGRQRASLTDLI